MKQILKVVGLIVLFTIAYLALWPVPIDPQAWEAPANKGYVGDFQENDKLEKFTKLTMGEFSGPEAAIEMPNGDVVATSHEGWVVKWSPGATEAEPLVDAGGRALGLDHDQNGNIWLADAYIGLVKMSPDGNLETVLDEVDGIPLLYADDIAITPNGKMYFSDASTRFSAKKYGGTLAASLLDINEHSDNGRILEYDPVTGQSRTIMDELTFANGVASSPSGDFILVAETGEYRVHKYWLAGEKAGSSEVIIENLPGFPDNIHIGKNGRYWVGLTSPRSQILDDLAGNTFMRKVIQRLPAFMRPNVVNYGLVFAIDENGNVLANLQSPSGSVYATTGVAETDEHIYVTSLTAPFLAKYNKADLGIE